MKKTYHRFSYQALKEVIEREILQHDAVIEGGIGNNVERYLYFRDKGYTGLYIGLDLDHPSPALPAGLIGEQGDCCELVRLETLLSRYKICNPVFVTNSALYLLVEGYENRLGEAVETLTRVFKKQLHIKPAGNFPLTSSRLYHPQATANQEFNCVMRFLDESRKRGWKESVVGKNVVLLKRE